MKCFVTGAAGFIGSHLCDRLVADGHDVIGFDDLSNGRMSNLDNVRNSPSFHLLLGDVVTGNILDGEAKIDRIDWFFHLAAKADVVPSIEKPVEYHKVNVNGTLKALEAARQMGVKKFVYAASSSCYGTAAHVDEIGESQALDPQYPYALTKMVGEAYALHWSRVYKLPTTSLRLFNVYGPRHRTSGAYGAVFGVFLAQLANNKPLTIIGDGNQTRDFTHVSDVVEALVLAAKSNQGGVFNIGFGWDRSVNILADLLAGKDYPRIHLPDRPGEPRSLCASNEWAKLVLGWRPKVSFEDGVAEMRKLIGQYKEAPVWTEEKIAKATETWFRYMT